MNCIDRIRQGDGFSLAELLISVVILLPVMGAALSLFSVGINQHESEQTGIDTSQEARAGLEMMASEIAQAGSHRDRASTTTSTIAASPNAQSVVLGSAAGFTVGDYVEIDTGANLETVELASVTGNSISGVFRTSHANGVPVRLFAMPYTAGVIPPPGLGLSSSANVTSLRFFGDIYGTGELSYVEYAYDAANNQITRSMTPITQGSKNPALPFIRNVRPNSVQFTLFTDSIGFVTAVDLSLGVQNTWGTGTNHEKQKINLSSRTVIPCAVVGSTLLNEIQIYGGLNNLPPTPAQVLAWAYAEDYY
jgi:hypothetical protein